MKHIKALLLAVLYSTWACTSDEGTMVNPSENSNASQEECLPAGWVSVRGHMNMTVTSYDNENTQTRAENTDTWKEGDKIYFIIESGQTKTPVVAIYSKEFSVWSFCYNASATIPASGTMKGCYLEGTTLSDYTGAKLREDGIVYIDPQASYNYQNSEFAITVHLKPSYVRIRFAGTQGQEVGFSGLSRVTSFDATTYTFEQTPVKTWLKASSTAENEKYYTPYMYGYLNADNKIYIATDGNTYGRTIPSGTLSAGESAWMNMPSENYIPKGWSWADVNIAKPFTVNGVTFNMIYVKGGTFNMGSTANTNEQPVHSVTLTKDYYIGETEVTMELYQTVMSGTSPTPYNAHKPVTSVDWFDCRTFITKLNSLTGLIFRLPTEAEWEYAARGGNKSKGYIYSGSDNYEDVACDIWADADEGRIGALIYDVKTKAPNELGIYDMSGNATEWCQDWYGNYSSEAQIDPLGPSSGTERVVRDDRVSSRSPNNPDDYYVYDVGLGFRLALSSSQEEPFPAPVPKAVDLGLSVKWASFNVGATVPEESGGYYAWGETEEKGMYSWETYKWCNGTETSLTKYCTSSEYGTVDNKTTLDLEDDVAHVKWGGTWRMPTQIEFQELIEKCTWIWTVQNGRSGYVVSANNGNSIFLPAVHHSYGYDLSGGWYWSSTSYGNNACPLYFYSGSYHLSSNYRSDGYTVRPVTE